METTFIQNVNTLAKNIDTIVEAKNIFDENIVPVLEEIANLDLQEVTKDLLKGNYLGNRKIDIDLSLNRLGTEPVSYYKAELVLTNGEILQIDFMGGGSTMELTSHADIKNYIFNDVSYKTLVEYTELTVEEASSLNPMVIRFRDSDGHSSNIERIRLFAYSGNAIESVPVYYWSKTTSALQTIANRVGDIIALGNDIDKVVDLAQRVEELMVIQEKLDELMIVFVNLPNITPVAQEIDAVTSLHDIVSQLVTLANNLAVLQNINTNIASVQNVSSNITKVTTVADKNIIIQSVYDNLSMLQNTYDNLSDILAASSQASLASTKASEASASAANALASASTATIKASEASASAANAIARANEIKAITAQAITGAAGTAANVSYNSADGKFTFSIPQGIKGDKGDAFTVNAVGTFANRANYNTQPTGFSYVATDLGQIYFKNSATSGDWSIGSPFGKGDKGDIGLTGNGISSIVRISGNGGSGVTDTYRITYTDSGTFDFNVYNGADSDIDSTDLSAHTNNISNPHAVTKSQVGLGSVDNTADSAKNVLSATKLTTSRTLSLTGDVTGSVGFDGSANVSMTTAVADNSHNHGNATITDVDWSKVSNKPDPIITVTLTGDVTGTANTTLTDLGNGTVSVATTISANSVALGADTTGDYVLGVTAGTDILVSGTSGEGWSPTIAVDATNANTANKIVKRDSSGNFSAGTITASLSGNATTATSLQNTRTINGVSFNGSANIDIEDRLGTAIASAATTIIGTVGIGNTVHITGTTTITSFGTSTTGIRRTLIFDGVLTITNNNTSLKLPSGISIVTAAGDIAEFVCENGASGYWTCTSYQRASGYPLTLGNLSTTGSAATATTANSLNTSNSYTGYGFTANGGAFRAQNWGNIPTNGVVYFGNAESFIFKSGGTWYFNNQQGFNNVLGTNGNIVTENGGTWSINATTATSAGSCTGNSATATKLTSCQSDWSASGVISNVVGMLSWKNFGNGHVIFDASASNAPNGAAVNNTNAQTPWQPSYPTLMGWNGGHTYGVRVDSARVADYASNSGNSIGYNQTWQDVTASRVAGATYTNSTGKPIFVVVESTTTAGGAQLTPIVSGVTLPAMGGASVSKAFISFIVQSGATYSVTANLGTMTKWVELK